MNIFKQKVRVMYLILTIFKLGEVVIVYDTIILRIVELVTRDLPGQEGFLFVVTLFFIRVITYN